MNYWEILKDAAKVAEQRQENYGEVSENFEHWQALCVNLFGIELSKVQLAQVMIALKLARESYMHNDDNLLDLINYVAIWQSFNAQK